MPYIPFHSDRHLKVRYIGDHYPQFKFKLFVVLKNEHNFDTIGDEDFLSVYPVNKSNIVNINKSESLREILVVKKNELQIVDARTES